MSLCHSEQRVLILIAKHTDKNILDLPFSTFTAITTWYQSRGFMRSLDIYIQGFISHLALKTA